MSRKKYPLNESTLGGRLRNYRIANNLNAVQFANLLGISQGSLSDIENNKTKPSATPVDRLIHKTDINIYWLFSGEGERIRKKLDRRVKYRMPHKNEVGESFMIREKLEKYTVSATINIADIPREQIKQWIDDFWKDSDEKERIWLMLEIKRQFPEFAEWLKKNEEILSEQNTSTDTVTNTA